MATTKNDQREYGIGRVPADVNPVDELMAEIEAAEIIAQLAAKATRTSTYRYPRCSYRSCRELGTMAASLGPACPDHYDQLSDA